MKLLNKLYVNLVEQMKSESCSCAYGHSNKSDHSDAERCSLEAWTGIWVVLTIQHVCKYSFGWAMQQSLKAFLH